MRVRRMTSLAAFLVVAIAAQLACNYPGAQVAGDPVKTAAAQTLAVQLTQGAVGIATQAPAATTQAPPPTPAPSDTPRPTATFTPTYTATPIPCSRAAFVKDVSVPDGQQFSSGATFTKTWRLQNAGSCTWTSGYSLIFDHGDAMDGPSSLQLTPDAIAPGQTVDVSVPLKAPLMPGTYKGYWKLRSPEGLVFGVGGGGTTAFWVDIKVALPPPVMLDFALSFENTHGCGGLTYATFRVGDTGTEAFDSSSIQVLDLTAATTLYGPLTSNSPFMATANNCPPGADAMGPGSVYFLAVSIGAAPPHGHSARGVIKLCTQDSLAGGCREKSTDFTVP